MTPKVLREAASRAGIEKLAPHDLRRYALACVISWAANWSSSNSCLVTLACRGRRNTSGASGSCASPSMRKTAQNRTFRWAYHFLSLRNSHFARAAAESAVCARRQGEREFEAVHGMLVGLNIAEATRPEQVAAVILRNAKDLVIHFEGFSKCVEEREASAILFQDAALAKALGVNSTPTVFVNGRKLLGGLASEKELAEALYEGP